MLVNTAMSQAPVKENIPYSWSKLAQVKSDHFRALAHYFVATILSDHQRKSVLYSFASLPTQSALFQQMAQAKKHVCFLTCVC